MIVPAFEKAKTDIIHICNLMITGNIDLIEGCRKLVSLRHTIGATENKIFHPIVAIDSETDHFPVGAVRKKCSPEYLQKIDTEIADYLKKAKPDILEACEGIIKYLNAIH